jgi:hypothetical protein
MVIEIFILTSYMLSIHLHFNINKKILKFALTPYAKNELVVVNANLLHTIYNPHVGKVNEINSSIQ